MMSPVFPEPPEYGAYRCTGPVSPLDAVMSMHQFWSVVRVVLACCTASFVQTPPRIEVSTKRGSAGWLEESVLSSMTLIVPASGVGCSGLERNGPGSQE